MNKDDTKNLKGKYNRISLVGLALLAPYMLNPIGYKDKKEPTEEDVKSELKRLAENVTEVMKIEATDSIKNYTFSTETISDKINTYVFDNKEKDTNNIGVLVNEINKSLNNIPNNYLNNLPKPMKAVVEKAREYRVKYGLEMILAKRDPEFTNDYLKYENNPFKTEKINDYFIDISKMKIIDNDRIDKDSTNTHV